MRRKSKSDDLIHGVVFRNSKDPSNWSLIPSGAGRKDSPTYGMKVKKISREQGLGIKNKYGLGESRDQYGSYGYAGKLPKSIFD